NIGNHQPVELLRYIEVLEECLGRKAERNLLPMQPGDVPDTCADVSALERDTGYRPSTPIETGVRNSVDWYRAYHRIGARPRGTRPPMSAPGAFLRLSAYRKHTRGTHPCARSASSRPSCSCP